MDRVVVAKDKVLAYILIVIRVHQSGFMQAGIHELAKVQLGGIVELEQACNKAAKC